jgi:hypothetical protein
VVLILKVSVYLLPPLTIACQALAFERITCSQQLHPGLLVVPNCEMVFCLLNLQTYTLGKDKDVFVCQIITLGIDKDIFLCQNINLKLVIWVKT